MDTPSQRRGLRYSDAGFTLIELLIYISVLAIIVLSVSSFFTWAIKSNAKVKTMREVADNARMATEIMTHEIREAASIYLPTFSASQLSLETSHYLPLGEASTYIDFYLCGNASTTLCFKKESQNPIALTSDNVEVDNLEFILIATTTPSVQINLGIKYRNPNNRPEFISSINLISTVSLRSY